jgi:hypothetical protein
MQTGPFQPLTSWLHLHWRDVLLDGVDGSVAAYFKSPVTCVVSTLATLPLSPLTWPEHNTVVHPVSTLVDHRSIVLLGVKLLQLDSSIQPENGSFNLEVWVNQQDSWAWQWRVLFTRTVDWTLLGMRDLIHLLPLLAHHSFDYASNAPELAVLNWQLGLHHFVVSQLKVVEQALATRQSISSLPARSLSTTPSWSQMDDHDLLVAICQLLDCATTSRRNAWRTLLSTDWTGLYDRLNTSWCGVRAVNGLEVSLAQPNPRHLLAHYHAGGGEGTSRWTWNAVVAAVWTVGDDDDNKCCQLVAARRSWYWHDEPISRLAQLRAAIHLFQLGPIGKSTQGPSSAIVEQVLSRPDASVVSDGSPSEQTTDGSDESDGSICSDAAIWTDHNSEDAFDTRVDDGENQHDNQGGDHEYSHDKHTNDHEHPPNNNHMDDQKEDDEHPPVSDHMDEQEEDYTHQQDGNHMDSQGAYHENKHANHMDDQEEDQVNRPFTTPTTIEQIGAHYEHPIAWDQAWREWHSLRWLWQDDPLNFYPPARVWHNLVRGGDMISLLVDNGLLQVDPGAWACWHSKQSQATRRQLVKEWSRDTRGINLLVSVGEWHLNQSGHFEPSTVSSAAFGERVWHCQQKLPSLRQVWRWQPMATSVIYVYHDSQFQSWDQHWGLGWQCEPGDDEHVLMGHCLPYPWFEILAERLESMTQVDYYSVDPADPADPADSVGVKWAVKDRPEAIQVLVEWLWSRRWFTTILVQAGNNVEHFLVDLPADHHLHWDYRLRTPSQADTPPISNHTAGVGVHYF